MPRRYRPREVARVARHLGWEFSHYHGDHAIFRKAGSPSLSVPENRQELARGTLSSIIRAMDLTRREFDRIAEEVL
jgi:predicted RNA binding protein YcfA (HicA-like mRNA interferase family)